MASLNKAILIGNVCGSIELRYTASGTAVASFSIATNEKFKNKSGEWEERAEFHNITLWSRLAEVASEFAGKGKSVYVEGRITTEKYTDKNGVEKFSTKIVGERFLLLGGKGDKASPQGQQSQGQQYEPDLDPYGDEIPF